MFLPKCPQPLVDIDLLLLWFLLQCVCISCHRCQSNIKLHQKNMLYQRSDLNFCFCTSICYSWRFLNEALCVLCVPVVVFTNSPQQNLPIGCPGLARLPNSISFLWESDGLASWYSVTERRRDGRRCKATMEILLNAADKCVVHRGSETHRCQLPPPPCQWHPESSGGRWRTEPT